MSLAPRPRRPGLVAAPASESASASASAFAFAATVAITLVTTAGLAHAGRPLATDDASTAGAGRCQVEAWVAKAADDRAWVFAPGCGLGESLELDVGIALPESQRVIRNEVDLALKIVPAALHTDTPVGGLDVGAKVDAGWQQYPSGGWQGTSRGVWALASWHPAEDWAVHLNVGPRRDAITQATAWHGDLGVAWTPHERVLVFAEVLGNRRHDVFGPTLQGAGARWWLQKDRLGLDATVQRARGESATWTIGVGWYGLGG